MPKVTNRCSSTEVTPDTLNLGGPVWTRLILNYCIPTRSGLSHIFGFLSQTKCSKLGPFRVLCPEGKFAPGET